MNDSQETAITEITIGPDGRVYVFGLSQEVLGVLTALNPRDAALRARLAQATPPAMAAETETARRPMPPGRAIGEPTS